MAVARTGFDDRNRSLLNHHGNQSRASTRNNNIYKFPGANQLLNGITRTRVEQLNRARRKSGGLTENLNNKVVGPRCLPSAAQDHAVAPLESNRNRIYSNLRPRFI